MNTKQPIKWIEAKRVQLRLLACVLTLVALVVAGCTHQVEHPTTAAADTAIPVKLTGYEFSPQETSSMIGNLMHQAHVEDAQIECNRCHRTETWITHEESLALCMECHGERIVAAEVWHNHCLSCHQFRKYTENYADSVHILRELCQDCHGLDSVIYTAFNPESPHDITCDNCHRPHETAVVSGGQVCADCHPEVAEIVNPDNKVHGSCLVCHTPHSPIRNSSELCSKCHYASGEILVHNVPDHPQDCLACHNAHFSTTDIGDEACQVCHDDTYYGGESHLPTTHRDCTNCHYVGNFNYYGDQACVTCHDQEGASTQLAGLPDEHQTCTSCHKPHHWYATFQNTCINCHEIDSVLEHNLNFHQTDCEACHDPHSIQTMAKSGSCRGCHPDRMHLEFQPQTPEEHLACENCHSQSAIDSRGFTFAGPVNSCIPCHTEPMPGEALTWDDIPFGHRVCAVCHEAHVFDIRRYSDSCNLCHIDIYPENPPMPHTVCQNCHANNHTAQYGGSANSCELCHQDFVHLAEIPAGECTDCHAIHKESEI
ncbi:hypothetical protein JW859_10430 [bacterium]|nr:hypothetical protein [bacterium]